MDNTISFEEKEEFVLKYFYDNFSTNKEILDKDNDMSEIFYNYISKYSISDSDYFLIQMYISKNRLFFKQFIDISHNFFVIKGLNAKERQIFNNFGEKQFLEKNKFYDEIIIEKNHLISLIISAEQNISFEELYQFGIDLDILYQLIYNKLILDNF